MKIDLKNAKRLQKLYGFGTSACWWSQACRDEKTQNEIAELLYGDSGLKLNIYRYNVGAGFDPDNYRVADPWRRSESFLQYDREKEEWSWDFSKDKTALEVMRKCLDKGNVDTLIIFANSPHYSHTSTGQASGSLLYHTCNIPKMNYKKFVNYFLDVTQHLLDEGFPVKYISPINEPQWKWGGSFVWQEGCHYEVEELAEIYHLFAEEIIERNMPVKLYGPETGEMFGESEKYLNAMLSDDLVMSVTDIFAYHSYHADDDVELRYEFKDKVVNKHPELRFDMSEWCELPNKSHTKNFNGALITARIIGQDIIYAGAESWTHWVAVNGLATKADGFDYGDSLMVASEDFSKWYIAKRYYAMAHFSKFIPVNSYALDIGLHPTNEDNDFNAFAFDTESSKVLVIVNEGENRELEIDGAFKSMKIVKSVQDNELEEIYNGEFAPTVKSDKNSIMTIILN